MTEIHLSDDDRAFIDDLVKNGVYKDGDEAVAAGLRLLGSREGNIIELQRLIQEGLDDVEAGRVVGFESAEEMTAYVLRMAEERRNAVTSARGVHEGAGRPARGL